jgi:hypothetical protein
MGHEMTSGVDQAGITEQRIVNVEATRWRCYASMRMDVGRLGEEEVNKVKFIFSLSQLGFV